MTEALSAMEYPHWLIVAGAILVVLGFVGLAFQKNYELRKMANGK